MRGEAPPAERGLRALSRTLTRQGMIPLSPHFSGQNSFSFEPYASNPGFKDRILGAGPSRYALSWDFQASDFFIGCDLDHFMLLEKGLFKNHDRRRKGIPNR